MKLIGGARYATERRDMRAPDQAHLGAIGKRTGAAIGHPEPCVPFTFFKLRLARTHGAQPLFARQPLGLQGRVAFDLAHQMLINAGDIRLRIRLQQEYIVLLDIVVAVVRDAGYQLGAAGAEFPRPGAFDLAAFKCFDTAVQSCRAARADGQVTRPFEYITARIDPAPFRCFCATARAGHADRGGRIAFTQAHHVCAETYGGLLDAAHFTLRRE